MYFPCHAGLDPASRRSRKDWIPAFAGMTAFLETISLWTDAIYFSGGSIQPSRAGGYRARESVPAFSAGQPRSAAGSSSSVTKTPSSFLCDGNPLQSDVDSSPNLCTRDSSLAGYETGCGGPAHTQSIHCKRRSYYFFVRVASPLPPQRKNHPFSFEVPMRSNSPKFPPLPVMIKVPLVVIMPVSKGPAYVVELEKLPRYWAAAAGIFTNSMFPL